MEIVILDGDQTNIKKVTCSIEQIAQDHDIKTHIIPYTGDMKPVYEHNNEETRFFSFGKEHRRITIRDIHYCIVRGRCVSIFYGDGEVFETYGNLKGMEILLAPFGFVRIRRSTIIASDFVDSMNGREIRLKNGVKMEIGAVYYQDVRRLLL